jgi:uncharacterized protein
VSDELFLTLDIQFNSKQKSATPILFCHGFKGFKDWGCNNLISLKFAQSNYFFIKFNFSFNGVILDNLSDISDAEAFGKNNYSRELEDIQLIINSLADSKSELALFQDFFDIDKLVILGHSRGGSMALISALEDQRIKKIISWGAVTDLSLYAEMKDPLEWQSEPALVINARTGDTYPVYYQFYEDYLSNQPRFEILENIAKLDKPLLIVHGSSDKAVSISNSQELYKTVGHALFIAVENGGHTFGASHPWAESTLPQQLDEVIEECIEFLEM